MEFFGHILSSKGDMAMKKLALIGLVLTVILVSGCARGVTESPEQACIDSGGTVRAGMCCKSVGDFPDICAVGACACAPDNSHEVKICDCGEAKCFDGNTCVPAVHSFQECVEAGYPVMESHPRQCKTPDGRTFTEGEEHCIAPTGEAMSLFEAKEIAVNSECGENLKEPYLEFSVCNADTGTWWIDLDIEKEGCNPACVVDIETKTAEINWRCTGVIPVATEEAAAPAATQPVVCWYGHLVSLPEGAQFDDYLALEPEGAGEMGLEGANAEIEAQIEGLRDKEEPGGYAHFWGTLTCPILDYGGCQLLVTRVRPEGPEGPIFDPDPVEGWEGTVIGWSPIVQFDDYFVPAGDFPVRYGIDSVDPTIASQLASLRDTQTTIRVWGQVTCPAIDSYGTHIMVTRIEVEGEAPAEDKYEGWKTYTSEHGYSLRYPPDCTFGPMPGHCKEKPPEERPPECLCFLNAEDPDRVHLQAFTGEKEDLKGAAFAVDRTVFRPPPGTELIEYVREKYPHFEEIPNEPNAKVGGIPAVRLYTPRSPMAPSCEEIFFIKDDKFFRILMLDVDEEVNRELYDGISSSLEISVETP